MLVGTTNTVLTISVVIAACGVLVAGLGVLWYVIQQRSNSDTSESDDARTEALALAETRGKRIDDLEADIERLRKSRNEDRASHDKAIASLRDQITAIEERMAATTRNFAAAQSLTAQAAYDLATDLTQKLEADPPLVIEALSILHAYTATVGQQSR